MIFNLRKDKKMSNLNPKQYQRKPTIITETTIKSIKRTQ